MASFEELYLANCLEALDLISKRSIEYKSLKFDNVCKWLTTLYKKSQNHVLDQETTYILLARYINLFDYMMSNQPDKKFVKLRFGSEYEKVSIQFEEVKKSLKKRYAEKAKNSHTTCFVEEAEISVTLEVKSKRVFTDEFITCQQLFSALQAENKILLVDARPETDFAESRICNINCINVPDHCISPGLSANVLGKKLPEGTQETWELRAKFSAIVLFDWNTSVDNFAQTKLNKLHSALVDWDMNTTYNEPPVILNGGYLEFLQMYPTICLNPHVYLFQKDNELDELLELDNIVYPTESDNKTHVMGVPEDTEIPDTHPGDEIITKEALIEEHKEILINRQNIITQLQKEEAGKKEMNEMVKKEKDPRNIAFMKKRLSSVDSEITRLEGILEELDKRHDNVKKQFEMHFNGTIDGEPVDNEEGSILEQDDPEKLKDIIDEERNQKLKRARALKPKEPTTKTEEISSKIPKLPLLPVINRATKPSPPRASAPTVEPLRNMTAGLMGLRNIKNTCYMNTLIQCLRNVPQIKDLVCNGTYSQYKIRKPAAIIHEIADLIGTMFSQSMSSFEPKVFYEKIGSLEPIYKQGNHEDCMEFFLLLLNYLSEDCCYDIALPNVMTPRQKAWYKQFEGKNSVFIDLFYHQIRIKQTCPECKQNTFKFEIESSFMVAVPNHDFKLEDLMKDYMDDYIIQDYCCSKCKVPVTNKKEISYEPKVMVIVLKRYEQVHNSGNVTLRKIEAKVHFKEKNFRLGNASYQLNAIVMHIGNLNAGHYTAAALTSEGWYEFNDEIVRPISINDDSLKIKACAFFYTMCDEKENN